MKLPFRIGKANHLEQAVYWSGGPILKAEVAYFRALAVYWSAVQIFKAKVAYFGALAVYWLVVVGGSPHNNQLLFTPTEQENLLILFHYAWLC